MASVGKRSTESAASPTTTRATVVKKPKTDCARLREECIVLGRSWSCAGPTLLGADEASWACLGLIDKEVYLVRTRSRFLLIIL